MVFLLLLDRKPPPDLWLVKNQHVILYSIHISSFIYSSAMTVQCMVAI